MNEHQKRRFAENMVRTLFNTVSGKKIAVLGWTFKKDINDMRKSPAINIAEDLLEEQASIAAYDPKVRRGQIRHDLMRNKNL